VDSCEGTAMTDREQFEAWIRQFIAYDPMTGILSWKEKPNRNIVVGRAIGRPNQWGHMTFGFRGRTLMVHRVAWFLTYGKWPEHQIDHINRDPADNSLANLRDVPQSVNMQNTHLWRKNTNSGFPGVRYRSDRTRCWRSEIKVNGKTKSLGNFSTPEEAHAAYLSAKRSLHDYRE
jgi:HNH endonuclease/AP2 domain